MGSPWRPKCIQVRKKKLNWTFSPPSGNHFWNIFKKNLEKNHLFFHSFLRPSIWALFHGFLLNFGCVFRGLARVLGKSWKQRFCNTFYVKSQIPRACWLNVLCILGHFSRTPSWSVFFVVLGVFRCHFWFIFGAKTWSRSSLWRSEKMMQKQVWGESPGIPENFENFKKWGGNL